MLNVLIIAVLVLIFGGAAYYVYKAGKSGRKCIGCPSNGKCAGCDCGCGEQK